MTANQLRRKYGDSVKLEYHDLSDNAERANNPEWAKKIDSNDLQVPVVTIDNQIVATGQVNFWPIVDAIEAIKKAETK